MEFFRVHSGSNVDFDENYVFLLSFCMILHRFWRIFTDFGGISMGLEWNFKKNSGFSEKNRKNAKKIEKMFEKKSEKIC